MANAHSSTLHHHFESYDQQRNASSLGMWLFLAQEVMFFGGLFTAYMIYRTQNSLDFAIASSELDIWLGGINTAILIASSFTMAMAVKMAMLAKRNALVLNLILTLILGSGFLVIKYFEYSAKFEHNTVPGAHFEFHVEEDLITKFNLTPERLNTMEDRAEIFFSLYFMMTGLHALHMVIGIGIGIWLLFPAMAGKFNMDYHNPVENFGLYWHFVDLVWIFLFPLLYLLGRNVHAA